MAARLSTTADAAVLGGFPVAPTRRPVLTQERRILVALGLARKPLPRVSPAWLEIYHGYLAASLHFPFEARCPEGTGLVRPWTASVTVNELLPPKDAACTNGAGLVCRATLGGTTIEVPLIDLEIDDASWNSQLIEDYWYWFWNFRFDPQI